MMLTKEMVLHAEKWMPLLRDKIKPLKCPECQREFYCAVTVEGVYQSFFDKDREVDCKSCEWRSQATSRADFEKRMNGEN